ncbi:hypothetical protein [Ornithinimicrobium kibberense]|uniref:hypothetical protein n=1 Tax=Ornithinimicrobium kibberense TaxID=282060 RepID=UPI003607D6D1
MQDPCPGTGHAATAAAQCTTRRARTAACAGHAGVLRPGGRPTTSAPPTTS